MLSALCQFKLHKEQEYQEVIFGHMCENLVECVLVVTCNQPQP